MASLTESVAEDATLACLNALGNAVLHGPDFAVGEPGAQRSGSTTATASWRGGCFGSDNPTGSRFVERILSTVATLSAQQLNVLDFLMIAHVNHVAGLPAPSLLPPQAGSA